MPPPSRTEPRTTMATQPTDPDESCSKCAFDRLPPEMIRFIFRKQSTDDLLRAAAATDRLYRVAQHHMYASDGALLVRGGHDTAATVTRAFGERRASALYLVDVRDFGRDVPPLGPAATLRTVHVGYTRPVRYADVSADVRALLRGARAERVCFDNVLMTAADVADAVSARLDADGGGGGGGRPPAFRCSYDRADDAAVLELLDRVDGTCAGLLSEFRVTVRRPGPRAYAVYPTCWAPDAGGDGEGDGDGGGDGKGDDAAAAVAAEVPEDLRSLTATDCSGLGAAAYRRLGAVCRRLTALSLRSARRVDDAGFQALAAMPCLRHLSVHGMADVSSDGLLDGLDRAHELRSLALAECPYVTDEVLRCAGRLRRLRRLLLDLTGCDKTTAAGVRDMLSDGCGHVRELRLTVPLDPDYVDAVEAAAALPRIREFRLTFDRLQHPWPQDRVDDDRLRDLAARFRSRHVDLIIRHAFTKIAVSVD